MISLLKNELLKLLLLILLSINACEGASWYNLYIYFTSVCTSHASSLLPWCVLYKMKSHAQCAWHMTASTSKNIIPCLSVDKLSERISSPSFICAWSDDSCGDVILDVLFLLLAFHEKKFTFINAVDSFFKGKDDSNTNLQVLYSFITGFYYIGKVFTISNQRFYELM